MRKKIIFIFILFLFIFISVGCNNTSKFSNPEYDLKTISSKEELKKLVKQPTNYWWDWFRRGDEIGDYNVSPTPEANVPTGSDKSSETSTTNVQVEGVDESDIVKNDDRYIYVSNFYGVSIFDTVEEQVYYQKFENFSPSEMYLYQDFLVVLGTEWGGHLISQKRIAPAIDAEFGRCFYYYSQVFKVIVLNVADKENITIAREFSLKDGYYLQGRMIENTLYLMLTSHQVYNYEKDDVVLPTFYDTTQSVNEQLIPYHKIKVIGDENYFTSYTVLASFEIDKLTAPAVDAYLGYFNTVYSSVDNLYLTKQIYNYSLIQENKNSSYYNTVIYRFNYQNNKMVYQNKAFIIGSLHDQFSLDEYDGVLRVAHTAQYINSSTKVNSESFVSTFDVSKQHFDLLASIGGMGINEQIFSTRFSGIYGYIVTFRSIDPLYVVDLSNPSDLVVRSELKSPGVSDYLHVVNPNLLLGIGRATDVTEYGAVITKGVKVSLFDVTNPDKTEELDILLIEGEYSYTELQYNHKALLTLPSRQIYALPVYFYLNNCYQQGMYVFNVNEEKMTLSYQGLIQHEQVQNNNYYYPSTIVRGVIIDGKIYTISQGIIGINLLDEKLTLVKNIPLA